MVWFIIFWFVEALFKYLCIYSNDFKDAFSLGFIYKWHYMLDFLPEIFKWQSSVIMITNSFIFMRVTIILWKSNKPVSMMQTFWKLLEKFVNRRYMRVELIGFFNLVSSAISKLFYLKMINVNLLTLFSLNHHKLFTMTPIYANLKKFHLSQLFYTANHPMNLHHYNQPFLPLAIRPSFTIKLKL